MASSLSFGEYAAQWLPAEHLVPTTRRCRFLAMKATYAAIDGLTFESEQGCANHEEFLGRRQSLISEAILSALHDK